MADEKKKPIFIGQVNGKDAWVIEETPGNWVETAAPVSDEELRQPVKLPTEVDAKKFAEDPGGYLKNATKHAIRDFKLPVPSASIFPPVAVYDAVQQVLGNKEPGMSTIDVPINTGMTRDTLTGFGGSGGMKVGGAGGIPGAIAGYFAGQGLGSLAGQGLEALDPDLFQSGYGSTQSPVRTEPSVDNTISDVVKNTAGDLMFFGGKKVLPLIAPKALGPMQQNARKELANWWLDLQKYGPNTKTPIRPPMTPEEVNAFNENPNVKLTVGQVKGPNSKEFRQQMEFRPDEFDSLVKDQTDANYENLLNFTKAVGVPEAIKGESSALQLGRKGAKVASATERLLRKQEGTAYDEIENYAGTYIPQPKQLPTQSILSKEEYKKVYGVPKPEPIKEEPIFGPLKLTGSQDKLAAEGKPLDLLISEIHDPVLSADVRSIRNRLKVGEADGFTSWKAARTMEKELGRLANNRNITDELKHHLNDIRATLVDDIEKNLNGQVPESAGYWQKGAKDQYLKAKKHTTDRNDIFPDEIQDAMTTAMGEVKNRPGERGGDFSTFFNDILKSPQDAARLAKVGGEDNAKAAFVLKFLDDKVNHETKQLLGDKALKEFESDDIKAISNVLLNAKDRQKLRNLFLISKRVNPQASRAGQLAMEQRQDGIALNMQADAANAALGGGLGSLLKSGTKAVSILMGKGKFVEHYMLDDTFARKFANLMGKSSNRPGMGKELADVIKHIQGTKLLIRADKQEYLYDTDTKKIEEVPKN